MRRRLSLRARLILGVIALAAVGLVAADFATYSALRSFLIHRTDASLQAEHLSAEGALFHDRGRGPGDGGADHGAQPPPSGTDLGPLTTGAPGAYVALRRIDGT